MQKSVPAGNPAAKGTEERPWNLSPGALFCLPGAFVVDSVCFAFDGTYPVRPVHKMNQT